MLDRDSDVGSPPALSKCKNTFEMNNMQQLRATGYLDALELFRSIAKPYLRLSFLVS
jgi:hypothetical protein